MRDTAIDAYLASDEGVRARGGEPGLQARLAMLAERHPHHARLVCCHADALHARGDRAAALDAYRRALAIDADLFDAWYGAGAILLAQGAYGAAIEALARALSVAPHAAGARCNLAEALFNLGMVDQAVAHYRQAAADGDAEARAHADAALALILVGATDAAAADILRARRHWLDGFPRARPAVAVARRVGPLRVGYLSAFFGSRNWMKPVWAVINRHDRARIEVHLLSDGDDPDAAGGYHDHPQDRVWRVRGMPNEALAARIRDAGLDVLVDLNGYSLPRRLPLFLLRPAPRILGWFNMFATTGTDAFDAIIGDAIVHRPAEDEQYAERVLRVPGSYLAFEVGYPVPEVAPPPCAAAGRITFGCFGSAYKLTDAVLDAWAGILHGAPEAGLRLCAGVFNEASNVAMLRHRLAARGVDTARVSIGGGAAHYDFLALYRHVDIALDMFPYNGGTTTTEALWQGVPVLTFYGDRWASRTSASLLHAAGLAGWVRADVADYVAHAIALANDAETPRRLAELRAGMRARLSASAVCDTVRLARALERIYAGEGTDADA